MPKESRPSSKRLRGELFAVNVSPKGHVEGALIATPAGTVQINFPKHEAEALARTMLVGSRVDLPAKLETAEFDHPVYVPSDLDGEAEVTGKVVRLNYALHGEVNGFHLDEGTFVHLKPEGAKRCGVKVGESVIATGSRRRGSAAAVLEARKVTRPATRPRNGRRG